LKLNPGKVLEIGCGGGDHLANMKNLMPDLECYGVELSSSQLNTLNARHPFNDFKLFLADLTSQNFDAPHVELVFTQAVLMHITERENRFQTALENLMNLAQKHVVLMENWTQHNFLSEAQKVLRNKPGWKIYFDVLERDQETRIMVISKAEHLPLKQLLDYSELLQNKSLEIH
jgi:trans-aconitate methyltransferase